MPVVYSQSTRTSCTIAWSSRDSCQLDDLAPDERHAYAALPHDARRRDWLAGRHAAKSAIATHCGVSHTRVRLVERIGAAPEAQLRYDDASWSPAPLSISISHHDGRGLAAVADAPMRVGVDLARKGEIDREHLRYFLAPSEQLVAECGGATLVWALKEAAWKALALTDATPFSALQIAADDARGLRGLWLEGSWIPATAQTWRISHDMIAAAVCVGAEFQ